jgi:hypothetical protein
LSKPLNIAEGARDPKRCRQAPKAHEDRSGLLERENGGESRTGVRRGLYREATSEEIDAFS